jgi:hypothetical protein
VAGSGLAAVQRQANVANASGNYVIEHRRNPIGATVHVRNLLTDGGLAVIGVPIARGRMYRVATSLARTVRHRRLLEEFWVHQQPKHAQVLLHRKRPAAHSWNCERDDRRHIHVGRLRLEANLVEVDVRRRKNSLTRTWTGDRAIGLHEQRNLVVVAERPFANSRE